MTQTCPTYVCFRYEFDVTKCMFSAGNITEKLRVAGFDCSGETVVDLYAGSKIVSCILGGGCFVLF